MAMWCLSGIPLLPWRTAGFPCPESWLNAIVLGVVGLFKPPVVPGVWGASIISQGAELSLSDSLVLRAARKDLSG